MNNFKISPAEEKKVLAWVCDHGCTITNEGAIGGRNTYQFTPTGLGTVFKVLCACGKEIDLTDYNLW